MTWLYLIRHGQAGTRDRYDELSAAGRTQARLLGEYLAGQGLEFAAVYAGAMSRQRQTAEEAAAACRRAGVPFPEIEIVPGWNEFDLDRVYRELAPALSSDDEEFRREYQLLKDGLRASAADAAADVHRRWSRSDTQIVEAWVCGRYPYPGESWEAFRRRVSACRSCFTPGGKIAVFTSATPIAIWAGLALDISDIRVMRLAGVLYNTSITVMRLRQDKLLLFSLNGVPHLPQPALRTHR